MMPRPWSNELQQRVVDAVKGGPSQRRTAELSQIIVSCGIRLVQRVRATGDVKLARDGGFNISLLASVENDRRAWIEETPDATIAGLRSSLPDEGCVIQPGGVRPIVEATWPEMKNLASHEKKTVVAAEQSREDVAWARREWCEWQTGPNLECVVLVDEIWTSTTKVPRHERGPRKQAYRSCRPTRS